MSIYQAQNCIGCPLRGECHKGQNNRQIELNHKLIEYRKKAKERLTSEKGLYHRSKRPIEPEAVFGQIKFNNKFNRFTLRGLEKVEIEFGLMLLAHNLRKITSIILENLKINLFQQIYWLFQHIRLRFFQISSKTQTIIIHLNTNPIILKKYA